MSTIPPKVLAADLRATDLLTACDKRGGPFPSITEFLDDDTIQRRAVARRCWVVAGIVAAALVMVLAAGVV